MIRLLPTLLLLIFSATVALPGHAENGLVGYWQHESEPVWIEIQPETGKGVMLRNDNRPDRAGFFVVTDHMLSILIAFQVLKKEKTSMLF